MGEFTKYILNILDEVWELKRIDIKTLLKFAINSFQKVCEIKTLL